MVVDKKVPKYVTITVSLHAVHDTNINIHIYKHSDGMLYKL